MMNRTKQQVKTHRTTTTRIMSSPAFELGFSDVRRGIPFDWRISVDAWGYERGRLFGHLAPLNMSLRIGGKLNTKAIALCDAAFSRRYIV